MLNTQYGEDYPWYIGITTEGWWRVENLVTGHYGGIYKDYELAQQAVEILKGPKNVSTTD